MKENNSDNKIAYCRDKYRSLIQLAHTLEVEGRSSDAKCIYDYMTQDQITSGEIRRIIGCELIGSGHYDQAKTILTECGEPKDHDFSDAERHQLIGYFIDRMVEKQRSFVAGKEYKTALEISEYLLSAYGGVIQFAKSCSILSEIVGDQSKKEHYEAILNNLEFDEFMQVKEAAKKLNYQGHYEESLNHWLKVIDGVVHKERLVSGYRMSNIYNALCALFSLPVTLERLSIAKKLLSNIPPPSDVEEMPQKDDRVGRFDQFYKLMLRLVNADSIAYPAVPRYQRGEMKFANSKGEELSIDDIVQLKNSLDARVAFFTAGSELYFEKYASSYWNSIVKNVDVSCLVFICASAAWGDPKDISKQLNVDDQRLIICSDVFDGNPDGYIIYDDFNPDRRYPVYSDYGNYYPSVWLLNIGLFVDRLRLPVFLTGIDTILNRGVKDLLESTSDYDFVVNKTSLGNNIGSKIINTLQLFYPTEGSREFSAYMNAYLYPALFERQQPFAMDQLFLFMAVLHVIHMYGPERVGYFDDYDINNGMFNRDHASDFKQLISKTRFINVYEEGLGASALKPEDIEECSR